MILITADLHLNDTPRDAYRHAFQKQLRGLVKQHKISHIFILGDLTDAKNFHSSWLVNTAASHFHALSQLCPVTFVKGNHDGLEPGFFAFLNHIENITWVSEPRFMNAYVLGNRVALLPHTTNPERDWADMPPDTEWVLTHNTFVGALNEQNQKMEGIPLSVLPRGATIISGDVHVPQRLGTSLWYVGAPYTIKFGDSFTPRVLLADKGSRGTLVISSIPCDGPQKQLVEISSVAELAKQKQLAAGDILKVRVSIDKISYARWPEILQEVRAWGEKHRYMIDQVLPVMPPGQRMSPEKRKAQTPKSDKELAQAHAKRVNMDGRTLQVGLDLIDKES